MELLVVTLVQTNPAREGEAMGRMRQISDGVRNAPGLLNARFYRSKEPETNYLLLTTWENSDWWQKSQERHSPRKLLLDSPEGIFYTPPDQWLMQYIWGYSRPLAQPVVATAHIAMIRPERVDLVQQNWLENLRQQAIEPILSSALLARSVEETVETEIQHVATNGDRKPPSHGPMFFNLLSWPGETYREDFYAHESYRTMQGLLNSTGILRTLKLDPM